MQRVCPDHILALFEKEDTMSEGRRLAVEWMKTQVPQMQPGDKILIPDPATGELMEMEYGPRALQS